MKNKSAIFPTIREDIHLGLHQTLNAELRSPQNYLNKEKCDVDAMVFSFRGAITPLLYKLEVG